MTINRRNIVELAELGDDIQDIEQMKVSLNETITELNFILRSLTMANIDGEIKTITIPASSTLQVPHKLGVVPKYKILLKQIGGDLIRDVEFTTNYIELQNLGGTPAEITIIIVKD